MAIEPYDDNGQTKNKYVLTLDQQLTYTFNDQGEILSKKNLYGDQIVFSYSRDAGNGNLNITMTDSYQRFITLYRNGSNVITGIKAEDNGTLIKQVQYNVVQNTANNLTYRKWTANGYQNVTENLDFWQLNNVQDITQPSNAKLMETYNCYR